MIPGHFDYVAPTTAADVVLALGEHPDTSALLAGGSWLVPALNRGERRPSQVIDLRRAGLRGVTLDGDQLRLGACTTYGDLIESPVVGARAELLQMMAKGITGGPQIVQRCTVGGSAVAARPGSDVPAALLLLGAVATVAGPSGVRSLPVAELWAEPFVATLAPDEVLLDLHFTVSPSTVPELAVSYGYIKIKHGASSWPIVTAAARIAHDARGELLEVQVAVGGATAVPFLLDLSGAWRGVAVTETLIADAARHAGSHMGPAWSDELAPAAYRQSVTPVAVRRALERALGAPTTTPSIGGPA